MQKKISVCRLFASSENSIDYESNPQYSCKFQKCFNFTYRSCVNTKMYLFTLCMHTLCLDTHTAYRK